MKGLLGHEGMLQRRLLSGEFLLTVAGLALCKDPRALAVLAGGYALARSLRKMYRPAFGGSSFATTEMLVLVAALGKMVWLGAPEVCMAAAVACFAAGRGLSKKLVPAGRVQHMRP